MLPLVFQQVHIEAPAVFNTDGSSIAQEDMWLIHRRSLSAGFTQQAILRLMQIP